jgi:predicted metal-dependent hydrolase
MSFYRSETTNKAFGFIVVHELVHLVFKRHTKGFWNEIDKIIPEYQKHIEWLKINGASMDI